jgi:hypothetical protein
VLVEPELNRYHSVYRANPKSIPNERLMNMKAQLTPYVISEDARTQAEAYRKALDGKVQSVMTYGQTPGTPEAIKIKSCTWQ